MTAIGWSLSFANVPFCVPWQPQQGLFWAVCGADCAPAVEAFVHARVEG